jgi:arylsulfatase A-like enzyme
MSFSAKNYFFLMLAPISVFAAKSEKVKPKQPNIIFIYSDDQRQDALGANGNRVIITPELNKMAGQGVRFTNANVVFALCSPSRAALLTGHYGSVNGVLELDSDLKPTERTVAQYLHDSGYLTGMSGKWHIGRKPSDAGFDFSVWFAGNGTYYGRTIYDEEKTIKPEIHCDDYCVNRSVDFLKTAAQSGKPFFLFHNTQLPHMNGNLIWDAHQVTKDKYKTANMPVAKNRMDDLKSKPEYLKTVRNRTQANVYGYPDSVAIQNHTRDYYSVITEMDEFLDKLFKTIDELGLRENTYIFFMSDNGWMLGDHGFTSKVLPYRPVTGVPLFVLGPNLNPAVNDQLVLNIDMVPTVLELAGIKKVSGMHGKSIVPLLHGSKKDFRQSFVYEGLGVYGGAKPNLTVISKDYRYIETYENNALDRVIFRELYDQNEDPEELNNLVIDKNRKKTIQNAEAEIRKHITEILRINLNQK